MKHTLTLFTLAVLLFTAACGGAPFQELPGTGGQPVASQTAVTQPPATTQPDATQPPSVTLPAATQPAATQPPAPQTPSGPTFDELSSQLADGLARRDLVALRRLMPERFSTATWNSALIETTSDEALVQLGLDILAAGAQPQIQFAADIPALLGGTDPLSLWGPVAQVVSAFHITGLGPQAQGEAVGVIGRDPSNGRLVWHGILVPPGGRFLAVTPPPGEALRDTLARALENRDIATLKSLMGPRFSLAYWNSEMINVTADEAMAQLLAGPLAEGAQPVVRWGADLTALLSGSDPLALWGPTAQVVEALHVMGLGTDANQEALVVIDRDAQGVQRWHGMLIPLGGHFQEQTSDPSMPQPTNVKYVIAQDDVNVRTGPGFNFAIEGLVREGQIAQVSGISVDGDWWQIICTQDASGHCWISADPSLTQPTTAP